MVDYSSIDTRTGLIDPVRRLSMLQEAYDRLLTGQTTVEVRDGDRTMTFRAGNEKYLEKEILKLQRIVGLTYSPRANGPAATGNPGRNPFAFRGRFY